MKKLITAVVVALTLATAVFAQTPQLTEVEKLKMQVANLQILLRQEQQNSAKWITSYGQCQTGVLADTSDLQQSVQALQAEINKAHPDATFDISTGKFGPKKTEAPKQ